MLWGRNRDMAISARAEVKDGEQAVSVTREIQPLLEDIEARLPSGYRIDVGGAVEESDKANRALAAVAPVMLVVILAILMLQLQSFSSMTIVLLTAPVGLVGAVPALLVTQAPLGFVAILGVIALSGMIMRNSAILVDRSGPRWMRAAIPGTPSWTLPCTARARRPWALRCGCRSRGKRRSAR